MSTQLDRLPELWQQIIDYVMLINEKEKKGQNARNNFSKLRAITDTLSEQNEQKWNGMKF
jgi:hypothetical protein